MVIKLITKVRIINFKQFKDIEISFNKNNILVGNNNSGKSTILEAITLALSGYYRGKNIKNCLSQNLFNREVVQEYLDSFKKGNQPKDLPKIIIEVHLDSPNGQDRFSGNDTINKENSRGFSFVIEFDEKNYANLYEEMVNEGNIQILPTEYYFSHWNLFSREDNVSPKIIPSKSFLIDSDNFQANTFYTSRIIRGFFTDSDSTQIIQEERQVYSNLLNCESIKKVNSKIMDDSRLSKHNVTIGLADLTRSSLDGLLNTQINGLPMDNAGKGEQCLVKTALSFSVPGTSQAERIILIEEPECHLSHSTLNILLDMINEEAKKYQIITTTHSSFVANKLGLNSLIMLNHSKSMRLSDLNKETAEFFEKVAGYDTLRLVLPKKAVLVEGDSDELIFQRAYMNKHDGKLPIQNGIDVISVGLAFKRFLSIAKELDIPVFVLTDNDGKIDELKKKYINFMQCPNIKISYPDNINDEDTFGTIIMPLPCLRLLLFLT